MRILFLSFFVCFSWMGVAQDSHTLSPESVLAIAGTSTVHDWEVTATSINGSLTTTDEVISDLKIEVPVSGIKSERGPTMDNKMYAALKSEEHPSISFAFGERKDNESLSGLLSVAGIEKEVEIPVKHVQDDGTVRISGTHEIFLKDHAMEPPTAMFGQIVVGEIVTVKFDLVFLKD